MWGFGKTGRKKKTLKEKTSRQKQKGQTEQRRMIVTEAVGWTGEGPDIIPVDGGRRENNKKNQSACLRFYLHEGKKLK